MQNTSLNGNRETPLPSFNIVTSQTAHVKHKNHPPKTNPPKPTPTNQPPTNQLPTNQPLQTNPPQTNPLQTQYLPQVGMGDKPKTKEVPKVETGDKPKTKEVPKVGMGDKPKTKEVPKVGTGDKPQISDVPKVGVGELPMVPFKQPPQRNIKFEQDRKRCITDTDGKNPHENKRVHRDACVSDLVWPICEIDNTEYSK